MLKEKIKYELVRFKKSLESIEAGYEFILKNYYAKKKEINNTEGVVEKNLLSVAIKEDIDDSIIFYSMLSRFDLCVHRLALYLEEDEHMQLANSREMIVKCIISLGDIINTLDMDKINRFDDLEATIKSMINQTAALIKEVSDYNFVTMGVAL